MLKKLPIGLQDFPKLIEGDYLYVDKTEYLYRLISGAGYYFLSRPRRFGKSLLISTLKAIFEGRRELFEGLWIQDKIDWAPRPVIHLDFTLISKRAATLEESIRLELLEIAHAHGIETTEKANPGLFSQLIKSLGKDRPIAILVDEYDKPLIDNIDDQELLEQNRRELKNLYSVLKGNDASISFLMLTGVTKFSQVSIFSDLNNLRDITLSPDYAQMLGYTQQEIESYFAEHIQALKAKMAKGNRDVMAEMKTWYNGYSWDGETNVYNPFSILNLLSDQLFQNYWFATGTPTFLLKLIKQANYSVFDLENRVVSLRSFNSFDLPDIEINSLLFQTGYLTIKRLDDEAQTVILDFPNKEVANAFSFHLLAEFAEKRKEKTDSLLLQMSDCLQKGDIQAFVETIQALFADIAYPIQPSKRDGIANMEKYYHSMFYLVLRLLGFNIRAEVLTHNGRIDAVVTTERFIYIIEFKLGDAAIALAQIKERAYHLKYSASSKQIILIGIGFDVETRNVGGFVVEEI